jgi:hypothetical protein
LQPGSVDRGVGQFDGQRQAPQDRGQRKCHRDLSQQPVFDDLVMDEVAEGMTGQDALGHLDRGEQEDLPCRQPRREPGGQLPPPRVATRVGKATGQDGVPIPTTDPARYTTPGAFCGDSPMFRVLPTPTHPVNPPAVDRGQEGVHVIDISDPTNPEVVAFVDTPCGSHTETLVPDLANNRLLVFSNPSANTTFGSPEPGSEPVHCRGLDIVEVPLDDPSEASYVRFLPTGHPDTPPEELHPCHDSAAILGDVMKVSCAGGSGPPSGASTPPMAARWTTRCSCSTGTLGPKSATPRPGPGTARS